MLNFSNTTMTGIIRTPPPIPISPQAKPSGSPASMYGRSFSGGRSSTFGGFAVSIRTAPAMITRPKIVVRTLPGRHVATYAPSSDAMPPETPMITAGLQSTAPFFQCLYAPLMAVGSTTSRFVPNATRIAIFVSIPIDVSTQYCTGIMIKHPPTPRSPEANPTPRPVMRRAIMYMISIFIIPDY